MELGQVLDPATPARLTAIVDLGMKQPEHCDVSVMMSSGACDNRLDL